jgi:hypothetical protein
MFSVPPDTGFAVLAADGDGADDDDDDEHAAAVIARAAVPHATTKAPRIRLRRHDGNAPIVPSSLL